MELNKLRLSQIDTSDIETSDFASQTQVNTVQSNLDSYATYANTTFSTGGGTATGNGVVFSTYFTTDASNTYSLTVTSNGAGDYDIVSGSDRASVLTGLQDPNVYIEEGDVISITNSASGHPLYIKYNSSIGTGDTVPGVTNQGADGGTTLTWDTSVGDAGTYFYQCSNHLAMNGYLIVQSAGTYTSNQYYTTSNVFTLPQSVDHRENLLVYLNGLLQHPDAYTVSSTDLTLANTDPLPINMKVAVRELAVAGGLANVSLANVSEARASNAANGTLTFDYEGSNLYIYDGTVVGGYYLPLTQAIQPGPVAAPNSYGNIAGYVSGTSPSSDIEKFPFASDTNSVGVGSLWSPVYYTSGISSSDFGYTAGGASSPSGSDTNIIQKFPFSSDTNSAPVGTLTQTRSGLVGQNSDTYGYASGGVFPGPSTTGVLDTIDKFPFATDTDVTDIANLSQARRYAASSSSTTYGYTSGGGNGNVPTYWLTLIDKFSFSSDGNATSVGSLTAQKDLFSGHSSDDSGYTSGGRTPSATNIIDKFPFTADSPAADVGDLTIARSFSAGISGSLAGYTAGASPASATIDKFPFTSDTNATNIGNLLVATNNRTGQQV